MLNNYGETGSGFNSNHGQTSRPAETQKQQNIGSTWGYNSQLDGMYYGGDHQPMFMGHYEGSTKHSNYPQYPSGTIHQPVPTPVVKCHEACCQHFPDRYPLNPAPLRYQPTGPVQPRYTDLSNNDSRQYFTDRRSMQQSLSRKKMYPTENGYPAISDRHFPQYMGRGQLHMSDTRQQMQMMRSQYPVYPYWSSTRGWPSPRMNCPPPPYHQSVNQGSGLKMPDGSHYMDPPPQKSIGSQHRRGVSTGSGGTEIIRPVPETKRPSLDPNIPSCYEFGYPTGFVPFSEVNKIQGGSITSQGSNSTCKIPSDKQYHPHQMQYSLQSNERAMMNCTNTISDLGYPMNFPMGSSEAFMRPGLDDGQTMSDGRKMSLQYDSSLGKKRPELDLRQYLATWEDDEDENTRITEPLAIGNSGPPYIVVDRRSLEGEAAGKIQDRYKTSSSQACSSKSRSSSPNTECKGMEEQSRSDGNTERSGLQPDFQTQTSSAPSMPTLMIDSDKSIWNGISRDGDGIIGKGGAFQPLDCSKRDGNIDSNLLSKRDTLSHNDMNAHKIPGTNDSANMSLDALVSYYGDNRRISDGGYDFVEMTERLVNNTDKSLGNRSVLDHQVPTEITRPCDPRLQQSQYGNNPSIYNKMAPRYPSNNYQHFKPSMSADPYYNYKHPIGPNKYFGYESSQVIDQNYDYHKLTSEFDARLYGNKDMSKDPRRLFHQEGDKSMDSSFLDPLRKGQMADCFPDKSSLEFNSVDPENFISPIVVKKPELDIRDKHYAEKNSAIRKRMNAINGENQSLQEKTVLITSENGPPEIFRVPYSPEKDISRKDNVVTLHSGDQSKSNTITVEVPYVQQYSTLVKLSEEISRTEDSSEKCQNTTVEPLSSNKSSNEEFKKPTSFKLKRLPNSKEWTVEGSEFNKNNKKDTNEGTSTNPESAVNEEIDSMKPVAVSNLNMPSLDDIRDGDENCDSIGQNQSSKLCDVSSKNSSCVGDEPVKSKHSSQIPQMAIVQPMKLNPSGNESLESNITNNIDGDKCKNSLGKPDSNNFDSDKIVTDHSSNLNLVSGSDSSKHDTFRTHKKIQSSFSSTLQSCLSSPGEDFLHSQDLNAGNSKEPYSPFHVYSDCDMNSQITDYFKIDDGSVTGEKLLDTRMPSSPGVEGMFEDINSTSQNQLYQSKSCNFQDLTDANMTSDTSHNPHFQSFSSIFSDDGDKRARSDGSILQMSDKKYIKQIFGDIDNDQHLKSIEDERMEIESGSTKENSKEKSESKRSPPIPTISLKLNESKKIWCIAKKDQCSDQSNSPKSNLISDLVVTSTQSMESSSFDTVSDLSIYSEEVIKGISTGDINNGLSYKTNESSRSQCLSIEVNKNGEIYPNNNVSVENSSCAVLPNKIWSKNGNFGDQRCLSVVKYYPKMKVIRKIASYHSATNSKLETLIFDTNGTHFPKVTDVNESKFVVKGIMDEIISNAVGQTQVMDIHDIVNTEITQINNNDVDTNNQCAIKSVIIYDRTGSKNKDLSPLELNVISTTKMFIQSEKEASKHQLCSVIKCTVQEDYLPVKKYNKYIRSIFSPRSEDLVEKEIISKDDNSIHQSVVTNLATTSDSVDSLVKSPFDIHESQSSKSKDNLNGINSCEIHNSKKHITLITVDDNIEEFRGFGSPKPNSPATCGHRNTREEIIKDDAYKEGSELLNLSSCKEDQNTVIQNDIKHHHEKSDIEVQQQKSVCNKEENVLPELICQQVNTETLIENCPNMNIFKTGDDIKERVTIVDSDDKMEIDNTNHSDMEVNKRIFINEIDDQSKLFSSNLSLENEICQKRKVGEATSTDSSVTFSPVTFPDIISSTEESPDKIGLVTAFDLSKPHVLLSSSQIFEERTFNEQCIKPTEINDSLKNTPLNVICNNHIDSQIVSNNLLKDSENSKDKECSEDVEARLETSVIVRNNSCNSVICSTSSDTSMASIEKEPISPSDDTMLVKKITGSTTEVSACANTTYLTDKEEEQTSVGSQKLLEASSELVRNRTEMVEKIIDKPTLNLLDETSIERPNLLPNTITNSKYDKPNTEVNSYESQQSDLKNLNVESINHCSDLIFKSCSDKDILANELAHSFYCVGESVFLLDDEFKKCLKESNHSYFFNFKKMKWRKYSKIYNKKAKVSIAASSENQIYNTDKSSYVESFGNNQETVNHDDLNLAGCLRDGNTFIQTHEIEKDIQCEKEEKLPINEKMCENEVYLQCGEEEKIPSEELTNAEEQLLKYGEENLPSKELLHAESQVQLKELNVFNTFSEPLVIESENTNEILCKDLSLPLKDKLQFFMTQEVKGCHIRRDSLKILEPEAVLKEIFSPDPEIENSESKENECPDSFALEKRDLSHQLDSAKTTSNIASNLSNHNEKVRFDNFPLIENEKRDLSNTSNTYGDDNLFKECQVNNQAAISDKKEDLLDTNSKCTSDLGEPLSSVKDFGDTNVIVYDCHNTEAAFSSLESNLSNDTNNETSKNLTLKIHTTLETHIEGSFPSQELQNEKVGGKISTLVKSKCMNKPVEDHGCIDSNPINQNKEEVHSSVDNNNSVSKSNESPIAEVGENLDNATLCSSSLSLKETSDEESTAPKFLKNNTESIQTNLHRNDSSSLNIESLQSHDTSKRRESFSSLSENNSVHCENDDIDLQKNLYLEKELPNTVEDSLANNQNLNKETFPLQCLVEAALALENGESKQTLLDKTNFNTIYTLNNTTKTDADPKDNLPEEFSKTSPITTVKDKTSAESSLTVTDKEIFSKFEENNYNLRASTRIVTSSSSNIIPYSKRKYGMKSKIPGTQLENKRKKAEPLASEKNRTKKRRGGFTYPRSKRRKKCTKDKKLCEPLEFNQADSEENLNDNVEFDVFQPDFGKTGLVNSNEILESDDLHFDKSLEINSNIESIDGVSKHDFGGPLLIANENTSTEGNIFCVHVNSDKMDEYVNHLNLGEIEVLSDNNQTVFKDSSEIGSSSEVPNVTLENGTSLVIIIEDLDTDIDKEHYNKRLKGESDIILGSIEEDRSPCLTQSNSMLDDCSNMLTSSFSVNESCICPPQFEISESENNLLKDKNDDEILESDSFLSKTAYEINDNIEDIYGKYSVNCNQELLTTNCYEEINENLVNDIGNWPFVEEEVAEFDNKPDLPNAIPEVGRKIELKCSLPWKKIFNISKNKKKKSKATKKISGLELGPANVEVRLKAPSAEWKVISDYHENSSPVVKVSRLILQRDSDNSSYSEKDSEEENENRRKLSESSLNPLDKHCSNPDVKSITENENWQPVVLLTRNKELDQLTLSMELKIPEKIMPSSIPTLSCDQEGSTEINSIHSSIAESDESENDNVDLNESNNCSDSSESSQSSKTSECRSKVSSPEEFPEYKSCANDKTEKVVYELYSPSGCNNESSNLNIYSPSDPHFSPCNEYIEPDEIPQDKNTSSEEKLNQNKDVSSANTKIDTNYQATISQSAEINLNHSYATINNELSKITDSYEKCNNDSLGSTSESKGENENSSQSLTSNGKDCCSDKNTNEISDTVHDNENLTERLSLGRKTKPKRKMPKNFFVRKKLRRPKDNEKTNDEKLIFGEESDTTKSLDSVEGQALNLLKSRKSSLDDDKNSSCLFDSSQSESQSGLSLSLTEQLNNSESDISVPSENSRLYSVSETEASSPAQLNEYYRAERIEVNQRVRDAGRGIKRPSEGHSKQDTKRRRKKLRSRFSRCEEGNIQFDYKEELTRHNTYRHTRHRELHHCMLCQRSFSSAARHSLHTQGRSHRHLELSQRHAIHAVHSLLVGGPCPRLPPLSPGEHQAIQWRPTQPGYTHVYHGLTPLQLALQEHSSSTLGAATSEDAATND